MPLEGVTKTLASPLTIRRIKLENFISHRLTEIDFTRGVNVLIGPNGAGKSSILEAIFFALTGQGWRATSVTSLVNKNATTAAVELEFEVGEDIYVLRRTIRGPGTVLLRNGKMVARDHRGVNEALKGLLGNISREVVRNLVIIMQGDITKLFTEEMPSKRKEAIDTLLGIHEYNTAYERLKEFKIIASTDPYIMLEPHTRESLSKVVEHIRKAKTNEYKSIIKEINDAEQEIKDLQRKINERKLILEREYFEDRKKQLEHLRKRREELQSQINNKLDKLREVDKKIENLENERSKYQKELDKIIQSIQNSIKSLEQERGELAQKKAQAEGRLESAKDRRRRAEKTIEEAIRKVIAPDANKHLSSLHELPTFLERLRKNLEDMHDSVKRKLNSLSSEKGGLRERLKDIKEKLRLLSDSRGPQCPLCGQPLTEGHRARILAVLEKEMQEVQETERRIQTEILQAEKTVDELNEKLRTINDVIRDVKNAISELDEATRDEEKYRQELQDLAERISKLDEEIEALRKREEEERARLDQKIADIGRNIDELKNEKEKINEEITNLQEELNMVNNEIKKFEEIVDKLREIESEVKYLEAELKLKEKDLNNKKLKLEKLRREVEEINRAIRKVYVVRWIRENVFHRDAAPRLLRAKYVRLLGSLMEDLLGKFNIEYKEVEVDEDYNVRLKSINYPGAAVDIKGLSGGEQVAVNLVALLALHKLVSGGRVGFMALDEPTAHLDVDRKVELIELLREFQGGKVIPQLIIVTHDEEVREAGDKIFMVRKVGGYSQVEEVPLERGVEAS
jgi:exonuclease SbcC